MTRPRRITAGEVVMGTRRCSERRFFLRPDSSTDQIFLYCLARAARITGVALHEFQVLSNHYHVVLSDVHGNRPEFFRELNQLVARAVNARWGRWEQFFAPGSYNGVTLIDGAVIEEECLYTLCNVVDAGLVKLPEYWDGVCSWGMEYGKPLTIRRPDGFFRDGMPEEETLVLTRPSALYPGLSDDEARARVREKARERAHAIAKEARDAGGGFMGMRRVRKQPHDASPSTPEPRRGLRPTVAGKDRELRVSALLRYKSFLAAYRSALHDFEAGERDAIFPVGTYLMARRFGVVVANC